MRMTVNFSGLKTADSNTLNLINALKVCKNIGANELVFDKGIYEFGDADAEEILIDVSNHGDTNRRKSAFLLKDFESFTINGNGSTFIFKGIQTAFVLKNCQSVTLKNFSVEFPDYPYPNGFVTNITDEYFDMKFDSDAISVKDGILYVKSGEFSDKVHCDVRFDGKSHEIIRNTGDFSLGKSLNQMSCIRLDNGDFRFFKPPQFPQKTDVFGILTGVRRASGILLDNSLDTVIQNVTIHSCIGIGIMAQCCHNVTVDGCRVTASEGRYVSSAADATHFVACTGLISIKNSLFEHMLDDAVNVHGIYTKVTKSAESFVAVRFMNSASVGIDIYKKGDRLVALDPETLKPFAEVTVLESDTVSREVTQLKFEESVTLPDGCVIENLTRYPELLFDSNTVQNNRARGMLIATNRKAVVKNCKFHTSGSAIVLECDGRFWYESGAVSDLTIENNVFDDCRYANWDKGVISIPEGKRTVDGFYYHGEIKIEGNTFKGHNDYDVYADNVKKLIYKNNQSDQPEIKLCHVGKADIDEGVALV